MDAGIDQVELAPSGLDATPALRWGSHVGHLFEVADELRDVLVPYFKAGLENNERCLWVTGAPLDAAAARGALRSALPDFDARERSGQIEIMDGAAFYDESKPLPSNELVAGLVQRAEEAVAAGFKGLRTNGNCAWVGQKKWSEFQHYESLVQQTVRGRRMICMCSYRPEKLQAAAMIDVVDSHDLVLRRRDSRMLSPSSRRHSSLDRQQQTFELAMTASQMGTWRYTLSDNVCIYDENAQRLYGLTEARFLHDEQGVRDKFHPDDLDLMWSRVARALDPTSDGRYDVEYRVKQQDGSWRWLSAWGLVEFEGVGNDRKPIAISGASRDLSDVKKAEDLHRLLVNELNHRIKNTLATVQAITDFTLHRAADLKSARQQVNDRIVSLARVHDLLTASDWTGANLHDLVQRALEPFATSQIDISGPSMEVSASKALALSLGLHELATNASKYGALSSPEGRAKVLWATAQGEFTVHWVESGGPRVTSPTRRGFGSRLIEEALAVDLGATKLEFAPEGVRCEFTVVV